MLKCLNTKNVQYVSIPSSYGKKFNTYSVLKVFSAVWGNLQEIDKVGGW